MLLLLPFIFVGKCHTIDSNKEVHFFVTPEILLPVSSLCIGQSIVRSFCCGFSAVHPDEIVHICSCLLFTMVRSCWYGVFKFNL